MLRKNGGTGLLTVSPRATLLQETLLRTDGTVTDLLELFTGENIRVDKVTPGLYSSECDWPNACGNPGPTIRDVVLRGRNTDLPYIFAHTHLFPERLEAPVQTQLSETNEPIGKVLRQHRLEDFRQIEERGIRSIPAVAGILGGEPTDQMRWRRYSVLSGGLVIMEITEVFSEYLFETTL
jgi:chorismate-pyruvate lyase